MAGQPPCDHRVALDCANLIAAPELSAPFGMLQVTQPNVVLDHLVLDGNREARLGTAVGRALAQGCTQNNAPGYNMQAAASGFQLTNSVSKRALCGSGLVVGGLLQSVQIAYSTFAYNGDHRFGAWSDGLTVAGTPRTRSMWETASSTTPTSTSSSAAVWAARSRATPS